MADEHSTAPGPDGNPGGAPDSGWTTVPQQHPPQQHAPQQYPPQQPQAYPAQYPPQQPVQGQGYTPQSGQQSGVPPRPHAPYPVAGQQSQGYPGYQPGAPRAAGTSSKLPLILAIGGGVVVLGIGMIVVLALILGIARSGSTSSSSASSSSTLGGLFGNSNPLIGSWKIVPDPAMSGCEDAVTFTDTTQTVSSTRGGASTTNVTYLVEEKKVAVVGNLGLGHAALYELMDNGQIRIFAYNGYCVYEKN
jgi:hypothetical protein